jgi:hypothetical protein
MAKEKLTQLVSDLNRLTAALAEETDSFRRNTITFLIRYTANEMVAVGGAEATRDCIGGSQTESKTG